MKSITDFEGLKHKIITKISTELGYLQVLEYELQDKELLHIVQWHLNNVLDENKLFPKICCKSFYKSKDEALKFTHEIGNNLLQQYLI